MVSNIHKTIPQSTSIGVCHNLSLRSYMVSVLEYFFVFLSDKNTSVISDLISLIHCACLPDSNLTFIASYATNNAKPHDIANITLSNQYSSHAIIVILDAIPVWNDGKPPAANMLHVANHFNLIESTITLINWIKNHTIHTINSGFIWNHCEKYCETFSRMNWNISKNIRYKYLISLVLKSFVVSMKKL